MLVERNRILTETIIRLMRRGSTARLSKIISKVHAADLPAVFLSLSVSNQRKLFQLIHEPEKKGFVISELDEDISLDIIEGLSLEELAGIIENMPSDDSVAFIKMLPQNKADAVLGMMEKTESEEVEGLLRYKDDTAGSIMIPDFIALKENMTAKDVIESLQSKEYLDVEMPFYIYVVDENERLVGVSSLRQLVVVPSSTPLSNFMMKDVISVTTDMDQEEVAKIVARYNILAVPVVDEDEKMVGIVTVDDVIDVFREEATEDILKMAGVGEEFVETKSIVRSTRIRLPWLFASFLGGIVAIFIIGYFEESLKQVSYLALFIPVIMGMGGNIGIQSSTIVVRGIATGRINIRHLWKVVSKELAIGIILGVFYGVLLGTLVQFQYSIDALAISVGIGVISSMTVAALVGSFMPMIFARIHIDPAVATGPFVTSSIDILSVLIYFQVATILLGI
ncbi:MAG: magnesium transporter [Desulfobacteraceae bacterium]|nr:magnesium transporter [Desulfobacteraceae bacterium]MBC2757744.1 magnesium transporter [Desulfobacteraceae bacterium]